MWAFDTCLEVTAMRYYMPVKWFLCGVDRE